MVIVKRRYFLISLLVVSLGIGTLGYVGYRSLLTASQGTVEAGIFAAERFLFAAVVVLLTSFSALVAMWATGGRVLRLLDRIHDLARLRGVPPENRLYRLGPLGNRISSLLSTISEVSTKRATKISGLGGLVGFLMDNLAIALVVTDARGIIRYVSERYADQADLRKSELLDAPIELVFPDIRPGEVVTDLARYGGYRQVQSGKKSIDAYGIFDDARHLVYVAYSPDRDAEYGRKPDATAENATARAKQGFFGGRLRELFDRKRPV